ncbi:ESX secretion-associated protein EspG [Nocardia sp. NPDC051832]|uniref:ESX secretion-associated protein EspG n=1 Tax=Nocardia sp. NPDC051832 TaxID=3155673 RepID=UPI00343054EF
MNSDPTAVDLNVDAALVLQSIVGIDSYPSVLALMPNIDNEEDRQRVHEVVLGELAVAGIVEDKRVHPAVAGWLRCLERPDAELAVRVSELSQVGGLRAMLRLSLVRAGRTHVLAARCDDHLVVQSIDIAEGQLNPLTTALLAALGGRDGLTFEPLTATLPEFEKVPADPGQREAALRDLGAGRATASVLTRAMDSIIRRAEIVLLEHHDGVTPEPNLCVSVLDTPDGRIVVTPRVAADGETWSTYAPGDEATLRASLAALIELLPSGSWFDSTRTPSTL